MLHIAIACLALHVNQVLVCERLVDLLAVRWGQQT